jgi:hypothetical protein
MATHMMANVVSGIELGDGMLCFDLRCILGLSGE